MTRFDFFRRRRWAALVAITVSLAGCKETADQKTAQQKPAGSSGASSSSPSDGHAAAAPAGDGHGYGATGSFDAVAANGPIFEDWPRPKLALVITGEQHGYLEPCGCAGLENQKGGLSRRHMLLEQLAADEWPVAAVDLGGFIRRFGRQAEIKYEKSVEAVKTMGYDAVGFGVDDLRLPAELLVAFTTESSPDRPSPFASANVGLFGMAAGLTPRSRTVEAGGLKIGVTSVLGKSFQDQITNTDIEFADPAEALAEVAAELKASCDLLVLLAQATPAESRELAKQFPEFDVVVTAGGADEPPIAAGEVEGVATQFIELGHKGMYAVVLGVYDDRPPRYQRVPLDARFGESADMKTLMTSYQSQLQLEGWSGLGLTELVHERAQHADDPAGHFIGAAKCGECHTEAYAKWRSTPHAHATETLTKLAPQRQYDPECLSCHATGWDPKQFTPFATGFDSLEATPLLTGNGCENCHGPGAAHAAAELGRDLQLRDELRGRMRLTQATAELQACIKCHDADNSPHFDFQAYWPKVEHKGKK